MLVPSKRIVARVGRVDAGDQVEERRLAGAVGADHADDLVLVDVQVELVRCSAQAAEGLGDTASSSSSGRHQTISTRRVPSSPCGRAVISHDQDHADHDQRA